MKVNLRKWKFTFLALVLVGNSLLQTGCGFKDIDKRLFVLAIGVDQAEGKENRYKVTLKLALPSGSLKEATATMYTYVTKESTKLADAIRQLKTYVDKEFDFGHLKTIVIGKALMNDDVSEITDMFLRRRDFQRITWVAVGDPTAEKVLKTEPKSEMPASVSLFNLFAETGVESPYIVTTYLFELRRRMKEHGIDPVLPVIQVNKKSTSLIVNHLLILTGRREPLELNPRQTKIYNMLRNNLNKMEIKVKKEDLEYIISIDSLKSNYKIVTSNKSKPVVKMNVDLVGIIEESDQYINGRKLDELGSFAGKEVENWVHDLFTTLQEKNTDPIGFGLRYKATRLHHKDLFSNWKQEIYPNLTLDVKVNVGIKSTGMIE
ncbi:Ger(x)C family spore germination protein [Bacillus tuaregi]|uniref:Ger(x)C family spore germination protein n=1 Tax=Bacillus tuaregi TaxID=1816695 RepID=UPI0008F8B0A7|nr:Ger(x)C family spore germination protein [Bacillus tuaregi]